jgi:hypothetical protein
MTGFSFTLDLLPEVFFLGFDFLVIQHKNPFFSGLSKIGAETIL